MIGNITAPHRRYRLIALLMLIAGLGSALVIYLTSGSPDASTMASDFEDSKRYIHDLELYGGKANVIAARFVGWFEGLWHGRTLAFTVAFLTVVISGGYFLVARRLSDHASSKS